MVVVEVNEYHPIFNLNVVLLATREGPIRSYLVELKPKLKRVPLLM
jgi:hypothetical protein